MGHRGGGERHDERAQGLRQTDSFHATHCTRVFHATPSTIARKAAEEDARNQTIPRPRQIRESDNIRKAKHVEQKEWAFVHHGSRVWTIARSHVSCVWCVCGVWGGVVPVPVPVYVHHEGRSRYCHSLDLISDRRA